MDLQTFLNDFMNKDDLALLVRDAAELFECPAMVVDMAFHVIAWHCDADFNDAPFRTSIRIPGYGRIAYVLLAQLRDARLLLLCHDEILQSEDSMDVLTPQ